MDRPNPPGVTSYSPKTTASKVGLYSHIIEQTTLSKDALPRCVDAVTDVIKDYRFFESSVVKKAVQIAMMYELDSSSNDQLRTAVIEAVKILLSFRSYNYGDEANRLKAVNMVISNKLPGFTLTLDQRKEMLEIPVMCEQIVSFQFISDLLRYFTDQPDGLELKDAALLINLLINRSQEKIA